jgi:hypothetical protein
MTSMFERAHGPISHRAKEQVFPLTPAPAAPRPAGAVGPVAPTTVMHSAEQSRAMMLATTCFTKDLDLVRRMQGGLPLHLNLRPVGPLGHICDTAGRRLRLQL